MIEFYNSFNNVKKIQDTNLPAKMGTDLINNNNALPM